METPVRSSTYLIPLVIACAALSMGNTGCEEQDNSRVLRMDVELVSLNARPVRLPNGETLDFKAVVDTLFYGQVMNNKHFVISTPVPAPSAAPSRSMMAKTTTRSGGGEAMASDENLLGRYGFRVQEVPTAAGAGAAPSATTQGPPAISVSRIDFGAAPPPLPALPALPAGGGASAPQPTAVGIPACLYNSPQAVLSGDVISFEASRGGGVRVGYAADGRSLTNGVGGKVKIGQTKLDMRLRTDDPLSRQAVAIGDGIAYDTKVDVSVNFAAGAPLGLDFFYRTALADVIKKAMDQSLEQIIARYKRQMSARDSWDDVWESRVLYDPVIGDNDTHVAIRGGFRASVQAGDRFRVSNARYVWAGAECASPLQYRIPLSTAPGALVEVVTVGDNVAVARVLENVSEAAILPGAIVKIESLAGADERKQQTETSQSLARR